MVAMLVEEVNMTNILPNIDPSKWGDFGEAISNISKNKLQRAEADKASMIANLLKQVMSDGGEVNSSGTSGKGGKLGISKSEVIRGLLGLPAETSQEREDRETRTSEKKTKNDLNVKTGGEIEEDASKLYELKDLTKRAKEILTRRPDLTGLVAGGLGKTGTSTDKDIGALHEIFGEMQAKIARMAGDRGGSALIGWATNIKPDIMKQSAYNMGMLDSMDSGLDRKYRELTHRYGIKTGNSLDDALGQRIETNNQSSGEFNNETNNDQMNPQSNQQTQNPLVPTNSKRKLVTVIAPDNSEHQVYEENKDAALSKYPGSRLKEESF